MRRDAVGATVPVLSRKVSRGKYPPDTLFASILSAGAAARRRQRPLATLVRLGKGVHESAYRVRLDVGKRLIGIKLPEVSAAPAAE